MAVGFKKKKNNARDLLDIVREKKAKINVIVQRSQQQQLLQLY